MIGCASIGMKDDGLAAAHLWHRLCRTYVVEQQRWRVGPHIALPLDTDAQAGVDNDAAANTADLPLMLRVDDVAPRYLQHVFGASLGVST